MHRFRCRGTGQVIFVFVAPGLTGEAVRWIHGERLQPHREGWRRFSFYSSNDSTSATNLAASSARYEATIWNTASLKPPMFRMSARSGACVDP